MRNQLQCIYYALEGERFGSKKLLLDLNRKRQTYFEHERVDFLTDFQVGERFAVDVRKQQQVEECALLSNANHSAVVGIRCRLAVVAAIVVVDFHRQQFIATLMDHAICETVQYTQRILLLLD